MAGTGYCTEEEDTEALLLEVVVVVVVHSIHRPAGTDSAFPVIEKTQMSRALEMIHKFRQLACINLSLIQHKLAFSNLRHV